MRTDLSQVFVTQALAACGARSDDDATILDLGSRSSAMITVSGESAAFDAGDLTLSGSRDLSGLGLGVGGRRHQDPGLCIEPLPLQAVPVCHPRLHDGILVAKSRSPVRRECDSLIFERRNQPWT